MSSEGPHVPRENLQGKTLGRRHAITALIEAFGAAASGKNGD